MPGSRIDWQRMDSLRSPWTRLPRPLLGWAALVLYGLCALLLPALHLSSHDRPHDHLPHGLRLHPLGAAHLAAAPHDESTPDHDHGLAPHPHPLSTVLTWSRPLAHPLSGGLHGQGSLAHFAAGYVAASPCLGLASLPALLLLPPLLPPTSHARPRALSTHAPRAPPVLCS